MSKLITLAKQDTGITYIGSWTGLGGSQEVQLETIALPNMFGQGRPLAKDDDTLLIAGVDFAYDSRLDDGTYNIYDTGASGSFASGKYFRLVTDNKNVKDPTGLNISQIIAKNLSSMVYPTSNSIIYVDPILGKFSASSVDYWSKCETLANMTTPDILKGAYSPSHSSNSSWGTPFWPIPSSGKFGNGMYNEFSYGGFWAYYLLYPFGGTSLDWSKGTISCWVWDNSYNYASSTHSRLWFGSASPHAGYNVLGLTAPFGVSFGIYDGLFGSNWHVGLYINNSCESYYNVSAGTLYHLYIVWDYNKGLSGSKSVRIFLDGAEVLSSTTTLPSLSSFVYYLYREMYVGGGIWRGLFDNLKIWRGVALEDPSIEYNSGSGNESYIGFPLNAKSGYYYISGSIDPVKLNAPTGAGNEEIQLESVSDYANGEGYFGAGHAMFKSDYNAFIEDTDFFYDEELDGSGTHSIDAYDDSASGAFAVTKYMRIVHAGTNLSQAPYSLVPVAKDLSVAGINPPADEMWIDPLRGKFTLPRPTYWSKCETVAGIINAEITTGTVTGSNTSYLGTTAAKFGDGVYTNPATAVGNFINIQPFGTSTPLTNKGTVSVWIKNAFGGSGTVQFGISASAMTLAFLENHQINGSRINNAAITYDNLAWTSMTHLYVVWDKDAGLTSGKSVRIFANGVEYVPYSSAFVVGSKYLNIYLYTSHSAAYTVMDNLKVWNHVVSEDPSWEYNSGTGREDALHAIYGSGNGYKPSLTAPGGVGYYKADSAGSFSKWTI